MSKFFNLWERRIKIGKEIKGKFIDLGNGYVEIVFEGERMEKLKEAINNEIKFLKEDNTKLNQENLELLENKKILNKMLSQIPTKVLIEELKGRTGIESADLNKKDIFVSALDEIYKIENSDVLLVVKY